MSEGFRIALMQTRPKLAAREANLAAMLSAAAPLEADLFLYPELATSGYAFENRQELLRLAESREGGQGLLLLQDLADRKQAAVIAGLPLAEGARLFNAAVLLRPGERAVFYRKLHLFDREKEIFDPGDRAPEAHAWRGLRLGLMICFDWIFPEMARLLALAGADLIAHCANLVLPHCQDAMRTRALENGVFCATANRVGRERYADGQELRFTGRSQLIDPRGRRLAMLGARAGGAAVLSIDPAEARDKSLTPRNRLLADRRPEHYGGLVKERDDAS
jgi:predicted amidohydrolase